ncbi:MAG TPA: nitroreductase family deazaflavin-dependent oxidoreductase [Ornithinibacter sp.]|nr:nitroreductase family deazaflavin-dependent oxidoreductase [Ornithinibacter sp.]
MGIAADLSYAIPRPNLVQRTVRVVASTRPGAWGLSRTLPSMDRAAARLSRGRTTLAELLAGLPVVVLTTTGRRTGRPRPAQLVAVPVGDTLAFVGTNFGQTGTPTWVLNLETDPRATVTHRDVTLDVVALPASETERAEVLARAADVYVGYPKYLDRVTGRRVRVFVLDRPAAP